MTDIADVISTNCTCKECGYKHGNAPPGTHRRHTTERARSLSVDFFYGCARSNIKLTLQTANRISEMSDEEISGCLKHLGEQFWSVFGIILRNNPGFAAALKKAEDEYRKSQMEKA